MEDGIDIPKMLLYGFIIVYNVLYDMVLYAFMMFYDVL
jgi:hypothetical protein